MVKITPEHWWDYAGSDLEAARTLGDAGQFRQMTFYCQQSIEKALKALILARTGETPPKVHRLDRLAEIAGVLKEAGFAWEDLLFRLSGYHAEVRYPDSLAWELRERLTKESAAALLHETEVCFQWLARLKA